MIIWCRDLFLSDSYFHQVSCASSSTELLNRDRYRYYFQLLATEADLAIGFYRVIKNFNWRRVAIFLQEEGLFIEAG